MVGLATLSAQSVKLDHTGVSLPLTNLSTYCARQHNASTMRSRACQRRGGEGTGSCWVVTENKCCTTVEALQEQAFSKKESLRRAEERFRAGY